MGALTEQEIGAGVEETLLFHAMQPEDARRALDRIVRDGHSTAAQVEELIGQLRNALARGQSPATKQSMLTAAINGLLGAIADVEELQRYVCRLEAKAAEAGDDDAKLDAAIAGFLH